MMRRQPGSLIACLSWGARLVAAFALLLAIGVDLAADTRCHPLPNTVSGAGLTAPEAGAKHDPCGNTCVADCFCCSNLSVGNAAQPAQPTEPARDIPPSLAGDCAPGILPLPYHPPLPRS